MSFHSRALDLCDSTVILEVNSADAIRDQNPALGLPIPLPSVETLQ